MVESCLQTGVWHMDHVDWCNLLIIEAYSTYCIYTKLFCPKSSVFYLESQTLTYDMASRWKHFMFLFSVQVKRKKKAFFNVSYYSYWKYIHICTAKHIKTIFTQEGLFNKWGGGSICIHAHTEAHTKYTLPYGSIFNVRIWSDVLSFSYRAFFSLEFKKKDKMCDADWVG